MLLGIGMRAAAEGILQNRYGHEFSHSLHDFCIDAYLGRRLAAILNAIESRS
jgi:hypothetical protein